MIALLVILAVLSIVLFGIGFTVHWLFWVAAILALIFVIALFAGGIGGRRRARW